MSKTGMSISAYFRTLNGREEYLIEREFGADVTELAQKHPTRWARALLFVYFKREGRPDPKQDALSVTIAEMEDEFFDPEGADGGGEPGEASSPAPSTSPPGA